MTAAPLPAAEVDAIVAANLRRLRRDACLAISHLAARIRIDPGRLAAAEGGAHLTCVELLALMDGLHVSLDGFFASPGPTRPRS